MKFSIKLLGKRVRRHINIKSVTLNVQSVRQSWTRMLAVAYESSGQHLPQVSEEVHSRSSPVLCDAPWLLMAAVFISSTRPQNSETCRRRYLTDAQWFYLWTGWLIAHATQDWRWSGMTFLRNLWQWLSRTFVSDCKHACSRLADTVNIQCDWLC